MNFKQELRRMTVGCVVLFISLMFLAACHRHMTVTNLPPGVSNTVVVNWYTAAGAVKTVSDVTNNATDAIISANHQGLFPDGDSYKAALTSLGKIAVAGQHMSNVLQQAPQNFTSGTKNQIAGDLTVITTELDNAQTQALVGIKDKNTQAAVKLLLASIESALKTLQALGGN